MKNKIIPLLLLATSVIGCSATESNRVIKSTPVESNQTVYTGVKTTLVVGAFNNRSNYNQGLFSSNTDRLGNQAKTVLKSHLQSSNRFNVVDRENLTQNIEEAKLLGIKQKIQGARYTVSGAVSEFGRKVTGDKAFFGVLGAGKQQVAYAKVTLNIVDVVTSQIIYSTQGAGEVQLSSRHVVGFGSSAGYDATLNGKVLDLAIKETVNNLVRDLEKGVFSVEI